MSMSKAALKDLIATILCCCCFLIPVVTDTVVRPFSKVEFKCCGDGDMYIWILNNSHNITDDEQIKRNITFIDINEISIVAIPKNNDTRFGCVVFCQEQFICFNEDQLYIKGVSPVRDMSINFTDDSLFIYWSPPSYHFSDDSHADLAYNVSVTNEAGHLIQKNSTSNTFYEVPKITKCDSFHVSVTAVLEPYTSFESMKGHNGSYSIDVKYNCLKEQVEVQLNYSPQNCPSLLSIDTRTIKTRLNTELFKYSLSLFKHYELTVYVRNLREEIQTEHHISISTYHVQGFDLNLSYNNGSVGITCFYCQSIVEGEGCHVIFNDTDQELHESFNITTMNELVHLNKSGNYTVMVYDIINKTFVGPAIIKVGISVPFSTPVPFPTPTSTTSPTGKHMLDWRKIVIFFGAFIGMMMMMTLISAILFFIFLALYIYKREKLQSCLRKFKRLCC